MLRTASSAKGQLAQSEMQSVSDNKVVKEENDEEDSDPKTNRTDLQRRKEKKQENQKQKQKQKNGFTGHARQRLMRAHLSRSVATPLFGVEVVQSLLVLSKSPS